jgi:hypothetical protein
VYSVKETRSYYLDRKSCMAEYGGPIDGCRSSSPVRYEQFQFQFQSWEYPSRMRSTNAWLNRNASAVCNFNLIARLLTSAWISVVILNPTEPRHPKMMDLWLEVRCLVSDSTDHIRSRRPFDTQSSFNPQTVASPACLTCRSVAKARAAVCRSLVLLRQET